MSSRNSVMRHHQKKWQSHIFDHRGHFGRDHGPGTVMHRCIGSISISTLAAGSCRPKCDQGCAGYSSCTICQRDGYCAHPHANQAPYVYPNQHRSPHEDACPGHRPHQIADHRNCDCHPTRIAHSDCCAQICNRNLKRTNIGLNTSSNFGIISPSHFNRPAGHRDRG